jgi:ion channel-forming bestrophin family protein
MIVVKRAGVGSLVRYVGRPLLFLVAFDAAVAGAYVFLGWKWIAHPEIPLSIFGGVIGVLAGFRNTSAYARWWEARTIWGGIVNNSRSFAREVLSLMVAPKGDEASTCQLSEIQRKLILFQVAYVHALRNHLRGQPPWDELAGLIPANEIEALKIHKNVPLAIQTKIASVVGDCYQRGWVDTMRWTSLDRTLSSLMDFQGASERIKTTPLPRQYDMFIRLFVSIYCVLLPFGMVASLKLMTPIGSSVVGFIFLALDQIGRNLENPFENLPHDIALTAISRTIEINLKQMIGEKEIPEPLAPVHGVLW